MPGPLFVPACFWPCCGGGAGPDAPYDVARVNPVDGTLLEWIDATEGSGGNVSTPAHMSIDHVGRIVLPYTATTWGLVQVPAGLAAVTWRETDAWGARTAVDSAGNVYVSRGDSGAGRVEVLKLDAAGNVLADPFFVYAPSSANFANDVVVDASDDVYVTHAVTINSVQIRKLNPAGAEQWVSAPIGTTLDGQLDFDRPADRLWAAHFKAVQSRDPATGAVIDTLTASGFDSFTSADVHGPTGDVWISATRSGIGPRLERWSNDLGTLLAAGAAPLAGDVAIDAAGNVYTTNGTVVRKYDPSATLLWERDHTANVTTVAISDDGRVYYAGRRSTAS